jgi:antitoxin component of RelBE/YafQ-DinJ toxin-antitoxin module
MRSYADGFNETLRVRCDSSLKERLERIAKRDDRDLSDLVRAVLVRYAYAEEFAAVEGKPTGAVLQILKELAPEYKPDADAEPKTKSGRRN